MASRRPRLEVPPNTVASGKRRRVAGLAPPGTEATASLRRREAVLKPNDHVRKVLRARPELAALVALELPTSSRLLHPADETDSDATSEDAEEVGQRVTALNRRSRRRIQQALMTAMEAACPRR